MINTCFFFVLLILISVIAGSPENEKPFINDTGKTQELSPLLALRIPKEFVENLIKYNTDFLLPIYQSINEYRIKPDPIIFGNIKFDKPIPSIKLQNTEATEANVDVAFEEYPANNVDIWIRDLSFKVTHSERNQEILVDVNSIHIKLEVMKGIFKPIDKIIDKIELNLKSDTIKLNENGQDTSDKLTKDDKESIVNWIDTNWNEFENIIKDLDDKLCELLQAKLYELRFIQDEINDILMFKVAPGYIWIAFNRYVKTKDDKSYQVHEWNNSTSLQFFILENMDKEIDENYSKLKSHNDENNYTDGKGMSLRQMYLHDGLDSIVDYYLTTDFIGQYYQTTPSISEQFGGNRKVDFVLEYTSKKIGDSINLYQHENVLNSKGDIVLKMSWILTIKVKNKSNSWVDFRNIYIEPGINANVQFTKDTQKGILKLKVKSFKLKANNLKIFNEGKELIEDQVAVNAMINLGFNMLNSYVINPFLSNYKNIEMPCQREGCVCEFNDVKITHANDMINATIVTLDISFPPLSSKCDNYFNSKIFPQPQKYKNLKSNVYSKSKQDERFREIIEDL